MAEMIFDSRNCDIERIFSVQVDVLFESDKGFWSAVSNLLRLGRRPILLTASDPNVVKSIPVNMKICKLLPIPMVWIVSYSNLCSIFLASCDLFQILDANIPSYPVLMPGC